MKIFVRGIYSTALTKFLLDKGYEIVSPSKVQAERFGIKENKEIADVKIRDLPNSEGITIEGERNSVLKIIEEFKSAFWDSFYVRDYKNVVLNGEVCGEDDNFWIVDTELGKVYVPKEEDIGDNIQIRIVKQDYDKLIGSTKIKLDGEFVSLIKNGENRISNKIRGIKKIEFQGLLKTISKEEWGIYIKDSAAKANINALINEIYFLFDLIDNPNRYISYSVIFGGESLKILDEIRRSVLPTIENHHVYRQSNTLTKILDFLESLEGPNKFSLDLKKFIVRRFLERGFSRKVQIKPFKRIIKKEDVIEAKLVENRIYLKTRREIKYKGLYDGLNIETQEGDYSITEYLEGSWFYRIRYYRKNGDLIGEYININTPIVFTTSRAISLDLEIDVIVKNGNKEIVDEDMLKKVFDLGIITEKLYEKAKEVANELVGNTIKI